MNLFKKLWGGALDTIAPEDVRLKQLLDMPVHKLGHLLPKANNISTPHTYALWSYQNGAVRSLIWSVKYRCHLGAIDKVGSILHDELMSVLPDYVSWSGVESVVLVPIPSSRRNLANRGWNQSEELCKKVSKKSKNNLMLDRVLEKVKETPHQNSLSREERLHNLKDSMQATRKLSDRVAYVLIDDVYTTGATIIEARAALSRAGARHTLAFTLAH